MLSDSEESMHTLFWKGMICLKKDQVLILARPTHEELLSALQNNETTIGEGDFRVAIFDPTPARIEKAIKIVSKNIIWKNKQDIWYTSTPLLKDDGKVAFVRIRWSGKR